MKRTANIVGALLTAGGVILLAYVVVSWRQGQQTHTTGSSAMAPTWSAADQQRGREIASRLTRGFESALLRPKSGPAPGSELAQRIVIPKINVNAPVVETPPQGGVWAVADWSVGHLSTTPSPGGAGNNALSAHDDIKGEVFKRLGELRPGDAVILRTRHAIYKYVVTSEATVDPSNVGVLASTAKPTLTLITCSPYWVDTQRLIVQALLKSRQVVA
ncbi:MAG: hypothetical protein NVS4B2_01600 [Chloroflexota bacterium]